MVAFVRYEALLPEKFTQETISHHKSHLIVAIRRQ